MNRKSIQVVFAEDNDSHAKLVCRLFEELGIGSSLARVNDGQELLDYLAGRDESAGTTSRPNADMILLDLRLPKVDGLEALRIIKSSPAYARIPVIVLTTSESEADMARANDLQASAYLVKPLDRQRLTQVLIELGLHGPAAEGT